MDILHPTQVTPTRAPSSGNCSGVTGGGSVAWGSVRWRDSLDLLASCVSALLTPYTSLWSPRCPDDAHSAPFTPS